jgi:hypothetical protein
MGNGCYSQGHFKRIRQKGGMGMEMENDLVRVRRALHKQ